MNFKIEIIGFTIEGCTTAQNAGAHRVELCDNAKEGGTTPSYGFIKLARDVLHIDLYPMIRPRGGDFFYSDEEFEIMKADLRLCKELGCNGVVTGCLTRDGHIDKKKCSVLVDMAYPLGVTFHRAFDRSAEPFKAMEDIIDTGFERILTSGQRSTAIEGVHLLQELIVKADDRIIVMPGSGIRSGNIGKLAMETGATEFHSSASIRVPGKMDHRNSFIDQDSDFITVDAMEVRGMIRELGAKSD